MELLSSIDKTWKLCTFWGLVFCFILILSLNRTQDKLRDLSSATPESAPLDADFLLSFTHQSPPPKPEPEPKPQPKNGLQTSEPKPKPKPEPVKPAEPDESFEHEHEPKFDPRNSTIHERGEVDSDKKECEGSDMYEGRWVYKEDEVLPYNSIVCPFLEEKMSCQKNGRPDSFYEKWVWQPTHCRLPRFNGRDMLEKLRNKRMAIVGDSLNRNQWESLACLLYTSIPISTVEVDAEGAEYKVLKAKEYNFVLEFHWTPFLIKLDEKHKSGRRVIVLDKISGNSEKWKGADIMVFNSGHWWIHPGKLRSWDLFEYEGKLVEEMSIDLAFERGMKTWASWVETNVDTTKTTVFFRGVSPDHNGAYWCYNTTQPMLYDEPYTSSFPKSLIDIVDNLVKTMVTKSQAKYLNTTRLSEFRRDAHPSIYRNSKWKDQVFVPSFVDCSHWCLPGLPDTWNRLLYASVLVVDNKSQDLPSNVTIEHTNVETQLGHVNGDETQKVAKKKCNIFDGRWVYKANLQPSYNTSSCRFIDMKVNCRKNGRPNLEYEKWSWEARDCDMPLFDARDMLERLRNKRLLIIGDSISRSQWESLTCLLYSSIPPSTAEVIALGDGHMIFKAKEYNSTVEFDWNPFLVELNKKHESGRRVLVLDRLAPSSNTWPGADIMVFNTGFWWNHPPERRAWDVYQYRRQLIQKMKIEDAFKRTMKTWANWIETNINPEQTTVFFRSMSAEHYSQQWCYNKFQLMTPKDKYHSRFPKTMVNIIEKSLKGMKKSQVKYFDIATMSKSRIEAHPSIYRSPDWENTWNKSSWPNADCSHWCLPGLPDTWNRMLYASFFFDVVSDF